MARRSRTSMILAGVALAGLGLLAPISSASAAAPDPEGTVTLQRATTTTAAAAACWTTIGQPNGNGTTITVTYRNCGSSRVRITPIAHAIAFDGTYTYVGNCTWFNPGQTMYWTVYPHQFPPVDTTGWGVTNCI
ncbi:hypothetical protein ACIBKY_54420 [Nonomuraea sp. NPDC050394]|uniref:hypothetical protein n=1 Tax=Nonomuraea sp. NPDC050394 TaxID=3364363 RepID=UPI003787A54A